MAKKSWSRLPVPRGVEHGLDAALDKALAIQRPAVLAYLQRVQRKNPDLTPAQLVTRLERQYLTAVVGIGGASGAAAAVPGAGTVTSVAAGVAEIGAFVSASTMYVLALAELHGLPVSDPLVRRALVLSVLLGDGGQVAVEGAEGVVSGTVVADRHWAKVLTRNTSKDKIAGINSHLGRLLVGRFGARQGALLFGRALPLGVGAVIGAGGNAALARAAIAAARTAFGPAPKAFPKLVVDAR